MIPRSADAAASVGAANRLAILESKVRQLQRDNEMLWDHIAWLLCCLLEKEIITEADARKYSTALAERATPVLLDEDSEQLIQKLPIDKEDPFFQILDPEIAVSEEDQGAPPTPHAD